jgi:hypothetical protein
MPVDTLGGLHPLREGEARGGLRSGPSADLAGQEHNRLDARVARVAEPARSSQRRKAAEEPSSPRPRLEPLDPRPSREDVQPPKPTEELGRLIDFRV